MRAAEILLFVTTLFSGLMAGLFYSYSVSVIPGLARLSDPEYLKAMQSINREIQQFPFFLCFIGLMMLFPLAAWITFSSREIFVVVLVSAGIYAVGVFGVTVAGNVPLNDQLEAFDLANASIRYVSNQRMLFEQKWNMLTTIRTFSSIAAAAVLIYGCLTFRSGNGG